MTAGQPRVLIAGSGFAGLGAAIKLREAGYGDITILERGDSVGGTWRDNTYPGAACDIPAHLYSFSFHTKPDWSTAYPKQSEIRDYLEEVADEFALRDLVVFGAEIVDARFDEHDATWTVRTRDGRAFVGDVLLAAGGPLSDPAYPSLPGMDSFAGQAFHSSRWDHNVDLRGRRVGVMGTGASSIQIVPNIADQTDQLCVFQRTAPWVIPQWNRHYSRLEKWLFEHVPGVRWLFRKLVYWQKELRFAGFKRNSPGMRLMERYALWHMERQIDDPVLRQKVTPSFRMGCKRILLSNDWYPTLARPDVEVVTDSVAEVTPTGVRTASGRDVDLDVLIYATGFTVGDPLGDLAVTGIDGHTIADAWKDGISAYLGTTVPGFPNLFILLGPNTGLGHNSMIFMMESQYNYLVDAMGLLARPGVAALDVRQEAHDRFVAEMRERTRETVWASGCNSWYLAEDGTNFTLWPSWTFEYWWRTRELDRDAYRIIREADLPARRHVAASA